MSATTINMSNLIVGTLDDPRGEIYDARNWRCASAVATFSREWVLDLREFKCSTRYARWLTLQDQWEHCGMERWEEGDTVPRKCRLVFAELKAERGRTSVAQAQWLEVLGRIAAVGGACINWTPRLQVYLWRPSLWPEIEKVLAR